MDPNNINNLTLSLAVKEKSSSSYNDKCDGEM